MTFNSDDTRRAITDRILNEEALAMPPSPVFDAAARAAARAAGFSDEEIDDMIGPVIGYSEVGSFLLRRR
jgi:hypothetical protein